MPNNFKSSLTGSGKSCGFIPICVLSAIALPLCKYILLYLQRIHLATLTEKWLVKDFRLWPRVPLSTYLRIMAGECIVHPFVFHLLLFECINCKIIIIIKCETRAKFLDNVVICPRGNACRVSSLQLKKTTTTLISTISIQHNNGTTQRSISHDRMTVGTVIKDHSSFASTR